MTRLFSILGFLLLFAVSAHAQPWAGGADPVQGVGDTGTPRGKVLTVQGIAGGTPIVVDCDNCGGGSSDSISGGGSTLTASATGFDGDVPAGATIIFSDGTTNFYAVNASGTTTIGHPAGQTLVVREDGKTAGAQELQVTGSNVTLLNVPASGGTLSLQIAGLSKMTVASTSLLVTQPFRMAPVTQATLPTATDGSIVFCSDCNPDATCTAAGAGTFAFRINGVWACELN